VDQRARDKDATLFPGRHLAHELLSEMRGLDAFEGLDRALSHFASDVKIRPKRRGREESSYNGIKAYGDSRTLAGQLRPHKTGCDHAEVLA